ncbi:hypothetical protein [Glaciihabitans sp. dw_435]|uniref:hypothetical protein n=1 Tax=Glaciihabitans sp. dw_435 TaxID=2720081 RepID=UPI001BD3C79D|nr:hypothetical protein [Glaciihabitans sp. dw_435]
MSDPFLPDVPRRLSDQDEETLIEGSGDGPDVLEETSSEAEPQPGHPLRDNPTFRRPTPGQHLTDEQLEADLDE